MSAAADRQRQVDALSRSSIQSVTIAMLVGAIVSACRERAASAGADSSHVGTSAPVASLPPWGTKGIVAIHEPPLTGQVDPRDASETYRFVWDRSFDLPIVIRIVRSRDHAYLIAVIAEARNSNRVARRDSVTLSLAAWTELTRTISQESFWRFRQPEAFPDGAMWMFERRSARGYRYAAWHSPGRTGRDSLAYAEGVRLLMAAGLDREEVY